MDEFAQAWEEVEVLCRLLPTVAGIAPWPKLQGPFPLIGRPVTYQATINDVNGGKRDDARIGLDPTPYGALRALGAILSADHWASHSTSAAAARSAAPDL